MQFSLPNLAITVDDMDGRAAVCRMGAGSAILSQVLYVYTIGNDLGG